MRIVVAQHVPFEGPAAITDWAAARGHELVPVHLYRHESIPPAAEALISMGGPMGARDEARYPWLRTEKQALEAAVAGQRPVLGICLGAQILADVLGAAVTKSAHKEIGWFDLEITPDGRKSGLFGDHVRVPALHWHGDTFAIPAGATHLARTKACENQAFLFGACALGLQFHLEATPESVSALVRECPEDLAPGPYVQSASTLGASALHVSYEVLHTLLDQWLAVRGH